MALNYREFLEVLHTIPTALVSDEVCGCGCGRPLESHPDEDTYTVDGKRVNEDCYFAAFGDEIDSHPLLSPRRCRPVF